MWLSYADSEVGAFHPVCEKALSEALVLLEKDTEYEVLHHHRVGTLEADFVIRNKKTCKYLCVFEVKRTPTDVHSSRYQYQAMSYVQMLSAELEKPFYVLTNLECSFAFRYEAAKPRVFQQMLEPGLLQVGHFQEDTQKKFEKKLTEQYRDLLRCFIDDRYRYAVTLDQFSQHMERIKQNHQAWRSSLAILLYEYIRGAFLSIGRSDLNYDVRAFRNNVEQICKEAARVNFKEIFTFKKEGFEPQVTVASEMLTNMFEFGKQNITADSVAEVLHEIVSTGHEHIDGEVPTDLELGRIVALLARYVLGDLQSCKKICDPCAGSGNLISTAEEIFQLQPSQVKANDINAYLTELLSLRLGLLFPEVVNRLNSTDISICDVTKLEKDYFHDVAVIVLNPPFVAGINCVERKKHFAQRIKELSGAEETMTHIGQMPLSGLFLELICEFVQKGTVISCVLPNSYLTSRGPEAVAIRKLLLQKFGLQIIFNYPTDGLFDRVSVGTCVLVGKVGNCGEKVKILSSYDKIADIDLHDLNNQLVKNEFTINEFSPLTASITAKEERYTHLCEQLEDGWRDLNGEMAEAISFINNHLQTHPFLYRFDHTDYELPRGRIGNSGGSDLLYIDTREDFYQAHREMLAGKTKPGLRNSKYKKFLVGCGDAEFFDITQLKDEDAQKIVEDFTKLPIKTGRQVKNKKTAKDYLAILKRESQYVTPANSILIPRALRKTGAVYIANLPTYVSTNFITIESLSQEEALVLATWMSTVFYQLICEASSKDNTGLRKMEQTDIRTTLIPKVESIKAAQVRILEECAEHLQFLDLRNPEVRDIDLVWAELLFGEEGARRADEAARLLLFLANRRNR